ncbi:MAG: tRNA pseudouridine(55) synthase [Bacteroidales bacterium]|nr:tRNA pseudouridine(55) synthase [Bacteroidales bacterium]
MPLVRSIDAYPGGIVLCVDKPLRWTSADVVRKIKFSAIRFFGKRNLKVGHAGTLDPLATGVLLVCIGPATKDAEALQAHDKEYVADVVFGATTPSYDREQEIDRFFPYEHIDEATLTDSLGKFLGEQDQIAPLFSAKSVDGKRAYELARKLYKAGKPLDEAASELIRSARIRIDEAELMEFSRDGHFRDCDDLSTFRSPADQSALIASSTRIRQIDHSEAGLPAARIRLVCTKGTYIRAFARDLGEELSSGAFLGALRRTRSGIFKVEDSFSVDEATAVFGPEPIL